MALQPSLRPFIIAGPYDAPHTMEVFIDYICTDSAKMVEALDTILKPLLSAGGEYAGKVKVIIRLLAQPWHSSSIFTHEAALAVCKVSPEAFWPFSLLLIANQNAYFDVPASNMTPKQIRASLTAIASLALDSNQLEEFEDLLLNKTTPNGGVAVTQDLKYTVKYARHIGIHVSPSVLWDGILMNEVSSGWMDVEWKAFLESKITV